MSAEHRGRSDPLGWRRRAVLTIAAIVTLAAAGTALLPVLTGSAGDVRHSYTADLPIENRGIYLLTDRGVMQLYRWDIVLESFPQDAPTLTEVDRIAVVARVIAPPDRYVLYDLDRGRTVGWLAADRHETYLELVPPRLAAGRYLVVAPADSSFGGTVRHYFAIDEEAVP